MVKYSILIPVYNVRRYLPECLDSVLNQTFDDYEAIVIDDGSDDGSGEICDSYARKDHRIKVYHQKNQGLMQTRKTGVLRAKGQYCLFLDSDDYFAPDLLECVDRFIRENGCDIVIYNTIALYDGKSIRADRLSERDTIWGREEAFAQLFSGSHLFSIFMKAIKTELILSHLDEVYISVNYAEDLLQTVHFFSIADSIGVLNKHLYYYRMRRGSLIHSISLKRIAEVLHVARLVEQAIREQEYDTKENRQKFRAFLLNDLMESVYKLNNVPMTMTQHIECLEQIIELQGYKELNTKENRNNITFYNSIRGFILNAGNFRALIVLDKFLHLIQMILQKTRQEKKFE